MKLSELIEELLEILVEHGNLEVVWAGDDQVLYKPEVQIEKDNLIGDKFVRLK